MTDVQENDHTTEIEKLIRDIKETLDRNRLVANLVERQAEPHHGLIESLVHKQNLTRLAKQLERLHAADVATILEALPLEDRLQIWELVRSERDGDVLLEVSDSVRESLIKVMDHDEILNVANTLDADELADLVPDLPDGIMQDVFTSLPIEERERLRFAMSYEEGTVGALMDFDLVTIRSEVTIEVVLRYLRRMDALPDHTDKLFVVARDGAFEGVIPLKSLLINDPEMLINDVMAREVVQFSPEDTAKEASIAFERYDLVSAPVIDDSNRLIGRITVDAVVDYIRESSDEERLSQVGLSEEEDIFAPVLHSVKNRAPWLAVNLVTALIASRVIGLFDGSIEKIVALAALMPIVAGMGGNVGNQTITMIVRELAFRKLGNSDIRVLYGKELKVALINGIVWGAVLGLITWLLYESVQLAGVMFAAVTLNFFSAAFFGVTIPVARMKLGRDPALGSSVMITAITDSGGFFIFLGLATIFLL